MGKFKLVGFAALWVALLVAGIGYAMRYETTGGRASSKTPVREPQRDGLWSCVMVVHPECPCSNASLKSLREVMARYGDRMTCEVYIASDQPDPDSVNAQLARQIVGAKVRYVSQAEAAEKLGAHTSGQVYIYDASGKQVFTGGLTASRGNFDSRFATDLVGTLIAGKPARGDYAVFGCPLEDEKS